MIRKVIAIAGLSGALALGIGGVASATTTSTPPSGGTATHTFDCSRAPRALARIAKLESKAGTWLPKAQAREATAQQNGHTTVADRIAKRIARVQKFQTRGTSIQQKIQAKCPGAVPAPGGTSSS